MRDMSTRLELNIDVLDEKDQLALVDQDLAVAEFIAAILDEFRELDYLSNDPDDYQLLRARDRIALDDKVPLSQQVGNKERLILAEAALPLPNGTRRPSKRIYLSEKDTDRVYRLPWCPAIIGRPDAGRAHNDWLAVNLGEHEQGLRVSRQHAQITEQSGNFYIESLSPNRTILRDDAMMEQTLGAEKHPLKHGDIIHLEQSSISLRFIIRESATSPDSDR